MRLINFIQMLLIFSIGAALTNMFGRMVGDQKQGWAIFAVMGLLFLAGTFVVYQQEAPGNPAFASLTPRSDRQRSADRRQHGRQRSPLRNRELRALHHVTTDASCGAVNTMHDSLMPLAGMVPSVNIMLGEIIFGGVGSGLYGMLLFAIVAVFIAGLMVGAHNRNISQEDRGPGSKDVDARHSHPAAVDLGFTPGPWSRKTASAGPLNAGPHGYSEILYAYTSATGNNGSAFAGISANTLFYNSTLGIAMLVGRFLMIIPMLAAAGSLAAKKIVPPSEGTFPTNGDCLSAC